MVAVLTPTSASTERPMALSIREEYTPPCSVPTPLRWMSSTSMYMTERPGSTSSTFAPMCLEKVTSSSKYRARRSSCSSFNAPPPSLTDTAPFRSIPRSTGDVEDLSAHERGLLGGQVQDRRRHVLRPAAAAHGYILHHLLYELLEIQTETGCGLPGHLRLDKPGGDGVHRDAVAAELDGEGLGEPLETRLGGRVVGLAAVAQGAGRGDVHYPAVSLLDHVPLRHPAAQEGPREVNVQDRPPLLVGHLVEEVVPGNTCVVDEDVEPAVALDRPLYGVLDLRAAGYVHAGREGVHAAVHERSRGLGGAVRLHVGQAHPGALA